MAFWKIQSKLHEQNRSCMSKPPSFGKGRSCSGGLESQAWPECSHIGVAICRVTEQAWAERKICQSRISQHSNRALDQSDYDQKARAVNDLYSQASDMTSVLQDPAEYLLGAVAPFPDAKKILFGTDGKHFQMDKGQAVYTYAHNFANAIRPNPPSPVIGAIQREVLDYIGQYHRRTIDELNTVTRRIRDFGADRGTYWEEIESDSTNRFDDLREQMKKSGE